ncbi:glutathione S-transferase family protein [Pannus brasiliensis CCIBt3594]|uniref:Glutathione S-transferase family protein n=1 Tax=Pannus brasiliensis CCIBt3594 TaxID=1427578 RepID=A0AAW9QLG5_9CHRO
MLKLYHLPISFNSRRVWIALLEKGLEFELIPLRLDGDQLQPEFLALNPFHRIPVLVDGDFTVIESLAILDYLEAKYPTPALLPADPRSLAKVKMVEMVTLTELIPQITLFSRQSLWGTDIDASQLAAAKERTATVLRFFESLLGDNPYFAGEMFTSAEIVAGTIVPLLHYFQIDLSDYPRLSRWSEGLLQRESWRSTAPTPEQIEEFKATRPTT